MNKLLKLTAISALTLSVGAHAASYEYGALFKDTRFLGMGNTNVAVGGESASLFHNPAGLLGMDPREGVEVELISLQAGISDNTVAFGTDIAGLQEKIAGDNYDPVGEFFNAYKGSPVSANLAEYTSIAYRGNSWAFSIGVLASANLSAQVNYLLSADGMLEVNALTTTGLIAGYAQSFLNNSLHVGLGTKVLTGFNKVASIGLGIGDVEKLAGGDMSKLQDPDNLKDYSSVAFDVGVMYDLDAVIPFGSLLRPTVGASLMNIGGIGSGMAAHGGDIIPTTMNVGASISPNIGVTNWFLTDLVVAVDYVDMLGAHAGSNFGKNLRMGTKASIIKGWLGEITGSFGMYNGDYTAGLVARLLFLEIQAATYAQEMGAYAGQNLDRRYQLTIAMGW